MELQCLLPTHLEVEGSLIVEKLKGALSFPGIYLKKTTKTSNFVINRNKKCNSNYALNSKTSMQY